MSEGLQGKRVMVTAGATGIGRVTANSFLKAGARVYVCDIDPKALQAFQAEQPAANAMLADVADAAEIDRLFDAVLQTFSGIDVVVNNAGIAGPTANVEDCGPADWDRTLRVNLDSVYLGCRRVMPLMKAARS